MYLFAYSYKEEYAVLISQANTIKADLESVEAKVERVCVCVCHCSPVSTVSYGRLSVVKLFCLV